MRIVWHFNILEWLIFCCGLILILVTVSLGAWPEAKIFIGATTFYLILGFGKPDDPDAKPLIDFHLRKKNEQRNNNRKKPKRANIFDILKKILFWAFSLILFLISIFMPLYITDYFFPNIGPRTSSILHVAIWGIIMLALYKIFKKENN